MPSQFDAPVIPIQRLFDGPLDLVGDVHGEWLALRSLLTHLGYDARGEHRQGRRLVFVGDLCDRGPDSPRVIEFVREAVERDLAQCVLGNHELNVLRQERKRGNGWYFASHPDHTGPDYHDARRATNRDRDTIRAFFAGLPLALTRPDLRVAHAAWNTAALTAIGSVPRESHLDRYVEFERGIADIVHGEVAEAVREELRRWGDHLHDQHAAVPLLPALAFADETYQMGNPLRVLTSGVERRAAHSFFASGKWRMVTRVPWWQEYGEPTPVVIGHYWRWFSAAGRDRYGHGTADLFGAHHALDWLGPRKNVFCVDYSVGARFRERRDGHEPGTYTTLAALRWPERELVTETGSRFPASGP
jgi:hypothetical protein